MALRNYTNLAPPLALSARAEANAITLTVPSTAGYPEPPFTIGLERGTGNEEVVLCTAKTATTFTVSRGYDNTTPKVHEIGTSVEHTVAAIDFREANAHANSSIDHRLPGECFWFAGATIPAAWSTKVREANGDWLAKSTYPTLWTNIQDSHLAGQTARADEFRVPDMRDVFPLGKAASGARATVGARGGTKDAVVVTHTHPVSVNAHDLNHYHRMDHSHSTNHAGTHRHSIGGFDIDTFKIAFRADGVNTNDKLVANGTPGQSMPVTYTRIDDNGSHEHTTDSISTTTTWWTHDTHGSFAFNPVNHTASSSAPVGAVSGTDQNLPPYVVGLWLIVVA